MVPYDIALKEVCLALPIRDSANCLSYPMHYFYIIAWLSAGSRCNVLYNFNADRLRAEDESFHMEIDMITKQIFCKGRYSGGGSFNALRLNASGDFNTTMS